MRHIGSVGRAVRSDSALNNRFDTAVIGQFTKYSFTGVFLTMLYAVLYAILTHADNNPMISHLIAYAISVVIGFFLNRYWSFRGHGGDQAMLASGMRFGAVSLLGFVLNSFFVWLLTGPIFNGPSWWPLLPIMFVTPIVTFFFNRKWAFS